MIERSRVRVPAGPTGEFSPPGSTFCADSYFGIRSTPMLPQWHVKNPGHSAKRAGGSYTCTLHFEWSHTAVNWYMMVYTELAPRRQQFHVAPATQQPNSAVNYTISVDIKNTRYKWTQSLIQNHMRHERSESARRRSDEEEERMS